MNVVRTATVVGVLALSLLVSANSLAGYSEDFTSTEYRDVANTTALWDTLAGEIRLLPFALVPAGSCTTLGTAYNAVIEGDYAFVADGFSGLHVVDIADPTGPTSAGSCPTSAEALRVDVAGDHAYLAVWSGGVQVIDITDPTSPISAGSCSTPGLSSDISVDGNYAFVADHHAGLQVVDISDPSNPVSAGNLDLAGDAYGIDVSGSYAYIGAHWAGLLVVDISDPSTPVLAGGLDMDGSAFGLEVAGNYVYVANYDFGLEVVDISDPANPVSAGSFATAGDAYDVTIAGDYAYVACFDSGVDVLDISDPTTPVLVESYSTPGSAYSLEIAGDYMYVADYSSGLHVVDISDPTGPTSAGSCPTSAEALRVDVAGDHAYLAVWSGGVQVIDITDPTSPISAGSCSTPGLSSDISVDGNYAFVADHHAGLQVVDISDPSNPVSAGNLDLAGDAYGIDVSGSYAYIGAHWAGLLVVDISDPSTPVLAGGLDMDGSAFGLEVAGNYVYVANYDFGLEVVDISDPANPVSAGSFATAGDAYDVTIAGDYAYVACFDSGVDVLDISDPTTPVLVESYSTPGSAYSLEIAGDYMYVADYSSGLHVVDISDPSDLLGVGGYDTPGLSYNLVIAGDYAYLADGFGGLRVLDVFQRVVDTDGDIAQSLDVEPSDDDVIRAQLNSSQTDSIYWSLSADGGASWASVLPGEDWYRFAIPSNDLRWRSKHVYTGSQVNPTCTSLQVDWLRAFPLIDSVTDVPGDQGGRVRLGFTRSGFDFADEDDPVALYSIWRRVDDPVLRVEVEANVGLSVDGIPEELAGLPVLECEGRWFAVGAPARDPGGFPPGLWEALGSFGATQEHTYLYEAATLADSTEMGVPYAVFCVTAHTTTPSMWYASEPDSGYSIDNLAPHVPGEARLTHVPEGNLLTWAVSSDPDFQYYKIYSGADPWFVPSAESPLAETADTEWLDELAPEWEVFYKIAAVDFSGNEGEAALAMLSGTDVGDDVVGTQFVLHQNAPNPFNPVTTIAFDVPAQSGSVRIQVFDVSGRLVRELVNGPRAAGPNITVWDGTDDRGAPVSSGVYYYRLDTAGYSESKKMTLLK